MPAIFPSISILLSSLSLFCPRRKSALPRPLSSKVQPWTKLQSMRSKYKYHVAASRNFSKTQHASFSVSPSYLVPQLLSWSSETQLHPAPLDYSPWPSSMRSPGPQFPATSHELPQASKYFQKIFLEDNILKDHSVIAALLCLKYIAVGHFVKLDSEFQMGSRKKFSL